MKTLKVVAAIIKQDNKILATQRGYGEFKGGWEFPGGKIEAGETPEIALAREIKEELNTDIIIEEFFDNVLYEYPTFRLDMDCYICKIIDETIQLNEHLQSKWLTKENLDSVNWLEADLGLIDKLKKYL